MKVKIFGVDSESSMGSAANELQLVFDYWLDEPEQEGITIISMQTSCAMTQVPYSKDHNSHWHAIVMTVCYTEAADAR